MVCAPYHLVNQMTMKEVPSTCDTYGGQERCLQGFGGETRRKETTWKTKAQMGGY